MFTNLDPVPNETDSIYLEMIGFQHSHYTGILSSGSVLYMSFFFMPHSLSITFQFHCLENKALIHHHIQFSTLTFGWTFFSLKMQMHTLLQGLLSFESNLIMIATSSVISQKLDVSTSAPFSFPDVRETVLLPSSSWLIWSLCKFPLKKSINSIIHWVFVFCFLFTF